jgi:hypothetical protein
MGVATAAAASFDGNPFGTMIADIAVILLKSVTRKGRQQPKCFGLSTGPCTQI